MENLRRIGRDAHLDVVVGAQLQIALDAAGRVLRPLAFVAVRQQHGEAAQPAPLGFTGGDELVDDHLRTVGEIAELRFPYRQRIRFGSGITVLEPQHRLFRQDGIDDDEVGLIRRDVLQRDVVALIELHAVLVMQHGMAMEERAAPAILAGQADRISFRHQTGIGEILGHAPVQRQFTFAHRSTVSNDFLDARMQLEVLRNGRQPFGQLLQTLAWQTGIHR